MDNGYIYCMIHLDWKICDKQYKTKIGSSKNYLNRLCDYITYYPDFDDQHLKLHVFHITESELDCSEIDTLIRKTSINSSNPYKHYNGTGGEEFYYFDEINHLMDFFNEQKIKYESIPITCQDVMDYYEKNILKLSDPKTFKLRDYQQKCVDIFLENLKNEQYFQGIYYLATGLGKSIIAIENCMEHLKLYPNDNILWITFRKDIVNGQRDKFDKYSNKFVVHVDVNKSFDPNILKITKGKIFVVLRQSIYDKKFVQDTVQGVIYDECHDSSKISQKTNTDIIDGQTYEFLMDLKKTQNLKYLIGMSATPLTNDMLQNIGIKNLYGKENEINYLYKYPLIEAVRDGWLCEPLFKYIVSKQSIFDLVSYYKIFGEPNNEKKLKKNSHIAQMIIKEFDNILNQLIYKKGIIWFPSVNMTEYFYDRLKIHWKGIVTVRRSTAEYRKYDNAFMTSEENYIMLACDKFKVGFDAVNLEAGINLPLEESGHVIIQKLGRFTRKKEKQIKALFYQFCVCEDNSQHELIESMFKTCQGLEINSDDIMKLINIQQGGLGKLDTNGSNKKLTFDVGYSDMKFDELQNKFMLRSHGSLRKLIIYKNNMIIGGDYKKLRHHISNKELIDTKKQLLKFINENHIKDHYNEPNNWIKFCLGRNNYERVVKLFYDNIHDITQSCQQLKITNIDEYKEKRFADKRLPSLDYINSGFYYEKYPKFNITDYFHHTTDIFVF